MSILRPLKNINIVSDPSYGRSYLKTERIYEEKGLKILTKQTGSSNYLLIITTENEHYICIASDNDIYKTVDYTQWEYSSTISNYEFSIT
jgi:hypothetical protein